MIRSNVKKWGNSMGVIIPKEEVERLGLEENDEIALDIVKKENPLKELFGSGKDKPITKEFLEEFRKEFKVSKWLD